MKKKEYQNSCRAGNDLMSHSPAFIMQPNKSSLAGLKGSQGTIRGSQSQINESYTGGKYHEEN